MGEAWTEEDFDVMILSKNVGNGFLSLSDSALRKSTEKYISRLREYFCQYLTESVNSYMHKL